MATSSKISQQANGKLLGILTAIAYVLMTLVPGSNTIVVLWPWVFVWQISLVIPIIWLLWQLWHRPILDLKLGQYLDILVGLNIVGILFSSLYSQFPNYAIWYGWATLCMICALYAVKGWLKSSIRAQWLLEFQGYLASFFIILSLGFWTFQTYLPELSRLRHLQFLGLEATFDFNVNSLRNWHPVGHPNYVAGYLLLVLPLLLGLGIQQKSWRRGFWLISTSLGCLCLYTTSSRGAWLALVITGLLGFIVAAICSKRHRFLTLIVSTTGIIIMLAMALTNSRLRPLIFNLIQGKGNSELGYRVITNVAGWRMGIAHPLFGLGLGSVPQSYQQYRPFWAGREAEMVYQLHSTPAHLWAELGIWGVLPPLLATLLIGYLSMKWIRERGRLNQEFILIWSILGSLSAYFIFSLTDYQLDNICISGSLIIYIAVLAYEFETLRIFQPMWQLPNIIRTKGSRYLVGIGCGITVSVGIWLTPIHRAWALSNYSFFELQKGNIEAFIQSLSKAHELAPWEVYYSYQLAWNLGDLSYQVDDPIEQKNLRESAIEWFQVANSTSRHHEFGYSNLGWLLVSSDPSAATKQFIQSALLLPAKKGVFFGLGFSLLQQGESELAIEAIALELMRHPMGITSPIWRLDQFEPIYNSILSEVERRYDALIAQNSASELGSLLYQLRGGLYWWQGKFQHAGENWDKDEPPLCQILLAISEGKDVGSTIDNLPITPASLTLRAWLTPDERSKLLNQAWSMRPEALPQLAYIDSPNNTVAQLTQTMDSAATFFEWLTALAPSWQPRSQRLGFGVLSRHIDGPSPSDFLPRIENIPMTEFFDDILPSSIYMPIWDIALQPLRQDLIDRINSNY